MPNLTNLDGFSNGKLADIAARLRSRMEQMNLSVAKLARRCETHDGLDERTRPNLTRERIAKILMNAQPLVGKGAARVVSRAEVLVLSDILDVAPEWLANQTSTAMPVYWDIAADPKFARQVVHLLAHYEEETGENFLWGENLLCSLTPPDFAHAYHENYFAEYDTVGLQEQKRILVETYDDVGNRRRLSLFGDSSKRNFVLTQVIFLSEMEKIVGGTGNYKGIAISARRDCLGNLAAILSDKSFKTNLIVGRDEDAAHIKHLLRDYDRFGVNGEKFSIWSYHSGKVAWSEEKQSVARNRRILEELVALSAFRERGQVLDLLLRLCDALKKNVD